MNRQRTSILVGLMALSASALALAQSAPPSNSAVPPPSDTPTQSDTPAQAPAAPESQSSSDTQSATNDPKLQECITAQKAKKTGLSENQLKQKCMLEIGSHQGH